MASPGEVKAGPPPDTLEARAFAKVNLCLRVLGRRSDGFHDLDTVIVPVDLHDTLEVHASSDPGKFRTLSLSLDVGGGPALTRGVPADESNLVLRAAKLLADRVGARGFAEFRLTKRIPAAGGLGGGSADAAAALRALNALWGAGLSPSELGEIAAEVGSDVPALLAGRAVRARGRGERVEPVRVPALRLALVTFGFGISTADAYGWWDAEPETGPEPEAILAARDPMELAPLVFNDLEGPVLRRHAVLAEAKRALVAGGAAAALLSGSGPTVAGILPPGRARLDGAAEAEVLRLAGSFPAYAASVPEPQQSRTPMSSTTSMSPGTRSERTA